MLNGPQLFQGKELTLAGLQLYLETWKYLEFDNLGKKKPEKTLNLGNFEQKS